jgi:hypothetical protein
LKHTLFSEFDCVVVQPFVVVVVVVVFCVSECVRVSNFRLRYGVLVFMPISGLAFGYASGWGVPFFAWNVPGAPKEKAESPSCNNEIENNINLFRLFD